jgi:hypothetical protein
MRIVYCTEKVKLGCNCPLSISTLATYQHARLDHFFCNVVLCVCVWYVCSLTLGAAAPPLGGGADGFLVAADAADAVEPAAPPLVFFAGGAVAPALGAVGAPVFNAPATGGLAAADMATAPRMPCAAPPASFDSCTHAHTRTHSPAIGGRFARGCAGVLECNAAHTASEIAVHRYPTAVGLHKT